MSSGVPGFVRVNDVGIAFYRWRAPVTPAHLPVVLFTAFCKAAKVCDTLRPGFQHSGEVIVPDLRGRGKSDRPADGYDPGTMADDVAALIEQLGVNRPCVVGRLHGGLIAYHLAARRPDLVAGVVLGDTNPEVSPDRSAKALAQIEAIPRTIRFMGRGNAFLRRSSRPFQVSGGTRYPERSGTTRRWQPALAPRSKRRTVHRVSFDAALRLGRACQCAMSRVGFAGSAWRNPIRNVRTHAPGHTKRAGASCLWLAT